MRASLIVGRQGVRRLGRPCFIQIRESGLLAVGAADPSEEMIERTIFHHHDDDVFDPCFSGQRQIAGARLPTGAQYVTASRGNASTCCGVTQKLSTRNDATSACHECPPLRTVHPHLTESPGRAM